MIIRITRDLVLPKINLSINLFRENTAFSMNFLFAGISKDFPNELARNYLKTIIAIEY